MRGGGCKPFLIVYPEWDDQIWLLSYVSIVWLNLYLVLHCLQSCFFFKDPETILWFEEVQPGIEQLARSYCLLNG